MFCKYCGKESETEVCAACQTANSSKTVEVEATPVNTTTCSQSSVQQKSKLAAGLLGIFLGALGVHNFYLGYTGKAIAQLLISILSCGMFSFASAIWGLIEGILILTGSINVDADGNALKD